MRSDITSMANDTTAGLITFLNSDNEIVASIESAQAKTILNGNGVTVFDGASEIVIDSETITLLGFISELQFQAVIEAFREAMNVTNVDATLSFIHATAATTGSISGGEIVKIVAWASAGSPTMTLNTIVIDIPTTPLTVFEGFFNNHNNAFQICPAGINYDANGGTINIIVTQAI